MLIKCKEKVRLHKLDMLDHDHDHTGTSVQLHKYYDLHSTCLTPNDKFRINHCGQVSPNSVYQTQDNFSKILII